MGRLVRKPKLPEAATAQASDFGGMFQSRAQPVATAEPGDDYLTRLVKYIPAEIIGGSMLVNAILAQACWPAVTALPPWRGFRSPPSRSARSWSV